MSERRYLKRNISLLHLVGIEIGQSIGAGIFALTGIALAATGPSLFLAFLAAAIPVALAMVVLAMLATAEPISGGTYYYGSRFFSPVASFTGVWAYILGAVLGMFPLYALTGATFLKAVIPALPKIPVALLLLAVFFATNLFGARIAVWVQAILVAILLAALFVFAGAGVPKISLRHFSPLFAGGTGGFLVASSILTFTILGANAAVELGDEILDPRKNIPRSFLISIPVVTIIYVVIGIVAAGVAPWDSWSDSSLSSVGAAFLQGPLFVFFIVGGGFLAVVTTLNSTYLWGTKSLIVITEDGLFPRALARINRRFGTPHWFLIIIFLVSSAALILAGDRIETFAVFASLGGIIIFIPVMGAALRLRKHHPELYARSTIQLKGFLYFFAPAMGLLLCLLVIAILLIDLSSHRSGFVFLSIFLVWVAAGAAYSGLRLARKNRKHS
jgi:APA family basic amino acid/polyamine antiporter